MSCKNLWQKFVNFLRGQTHLAGEQADGAARCSKCNRPLSKAGQCPQGHSPEPEEAGPWGDRFREGAEELAGRVLDGVDTLSARATDLETTVDEKVGDWLDSPAGEKATDALLRLGEFMDRLDEYRATIDEVVDNWWNGGAGDKIMDALDRAVDFTDRVIEAGGTAVEKVREFLSPQEGTGPAQTGPGSGRPG